MIKRFFIFIRSLLSKQPKRQGFKVLTEEEKARIVKSQVKIQESYKTAYKEQWGKYKGLADLLWPM